MASEKARIHRDRLMVGRACCAAVPRAVIHGSFAFRSAAVVRATATAASVSGV
jgi:hypothetical protein